MDSKMDLDGSINDLAVKRFGEIRSRMKLDLLTATLIKTGAGSGVHNLLKFEESVINGEFDNPNITPEVAYECKDNIKFVDDTFSFINSLNLPPQLSLAIGLIISAHKTKDKRDLEKAQAAIEEVLNCPN